MYFHENDLIDLSHKNSGIIAVATTRDPNQTKVIHDTDIRLSQAIGYKIEHCRIVEDVSRAMRNIRESLAIYRRQANGDIYNMDIYDTIELVDEIINEMQSTVYKDIRFRTRLQARWAAFFDTLGIPYEYATEPFKISSQIYYQPDFWLPSQDAWLIIRKNRMNHNEDRLMGLAFVQHTDKILFAFNECRKTVYHQDNYVLYSGQYLNAEGDFDGIMEWGHCEECNSFHIGHMGCHDVCDTMGHSTEKDVCYTAPKKHQQQEQDDMNPGQIPTSSGMSDHPKLVKAFDTANMMI
ncbi:hypothetical protein MTBBW1_2710007 [Desulfamplus magnetovallimortis]|uniref:Uncharacterized protein n=1 Tax=Desulfamplus magnetovallimortis TaxID=1246637 RepID=A0A1W1HF70_9BACT|nr:hypothetical protein [Desulfamplus magnetovallimortis]SLM31120.1 hypothetical protein MTBBW1_2710007 [Desulfamplus magnetovallimortis]